MSRDEDIIANEISLWLFEVVQGSWPIGFAAMRIATDFKAEAPLRWVLEISFVEGALVIHGEFCIVFQEMGQAKEGVSDGRWGDSRES